MEPDERADFWDRHGGTIAWSFVALGVTVRLVRYLLRFPLWGDEMMLADNLLTRDYAGLAGGLDHSQVAPLGYLWALKAVVSAFGFNEYSLRAVAVFGGIAGLVLFRVAAGHVLRGLPLVLVVACLSVAYFPIRHAAEVKPYAVDLLAAVLLVEPLLAWLRNPARTTPLWRLAPAALFATSFSFPAVFVGGGVSLALGYEAWRRRSKSAIAPWLAFNAALVGTFAVLYFAVMRSHYDVSGTALGSYWVTGFPPSLSEPWQCLKWLVAAHIGEVFAYPLGGDAGGGAVQLILAIVGAVAFWRLGRRGLVIAAAVTAALGLSAAVMHRYPYGFGVRLQQHWAPLLSLLIGQGAALALAAIRSDWIRKHAVRATLMGCAAIGGGMLIRDLVRPYKIGHDAVHRDFSRWFWSQGAQGEPLVDLEEELATPVFSSYQALPYRIYKHIYDRRPQRLVDVSEVEPLTIESRIEALPAGTAIRCVAFGRRGAEPDPVRFAAWMEQMSRSHRLVDERRYPMRIDVNGEPATYHVWRFEPRTDAAARPIARSSATTRRR